MKYTFICTEHEEYGSIGWKPSNMPAFDPLMGMGIAHDILEHMPKDDSTTGELMALGASMHIRGNEYYVRKGRINPNPSYQMHGEIAELLYKVSTGEWADVQPVNIPSCKINDKWITFLINDTVALVEHYLRHESETFNDVQHDMPDWEDKVSHWLAFGYKNALRRYKNVTQDELLNTFNFIETYADKAIRTAYEGQILDINLTWETSGNSRKAKLRMRSLDN